MPESIFTRIKNHFKRHKFAYLFGASTVFLAAMNARSAKEFDRFLESRDIDPWEFWGEDLIAEVEEHKKNKKKHKKHS